MQDHSLIDVEETLRQGGRSFHWARRFLGQQMGHDAARLYAFCRLIDDMADGDIADGPARLAVIRKDLVSRTPPKTPPLLSLLPLWPKNPSPKTP